MIVRQQGLFGYRPGMESVRVILEVVAGVLPGTPEEDLTKRWMITSQEWEDAGENVSTLLAERNGQAQGYAALLMLQPSRLNWVRLEWLWT